jgi:hypothetical protein
MIIVGLSDRDALAFGGYGAAPTISEQRLKGSDVLTIGHGSLTTTIEFLGIDHKIYNRLG